MELKKNPNAKRQFCPLIFEVCDASFVSLIQMLRLLTNNCSALLHLFSQRTAYGSRFFAPAARRDSKTKKGCEKVLQSPFFSWILFVRTEIPCLRPKRYAQLRSQSQLCLTKCAPPIPVL
jgi:hypothetical protein